MLHDGAAETRWLPPSLGIVLYSTVPTDGQLVVVVVDPTELFFLLRGIFCDYDFVAAIPEAVKLRVACIRIPHRDDCRCADWYLL